MHFRIVKGIQNHKLISDKKMLSAEGAHSVIYLGIILYNFRNLQTSLIRYSFYLSI